MHNAECLWADMHRDIMAQPSSVITRPMDHSIVAQPPQQEPEIHRVCLLTSIDFAFQHCKEQELTRYSRRIKETWTYIIGEKEEEQLLLEESR